MNITKKDFELLEDIYNLLPCGSKLTELTPTEQDTITQFTFMLARLDRARKESNKKTAEYIAERRKTDKNYARSKKGGISCYRY